MNNNNKEVQVLTLPELSKKVGISYNILKMFCDRYDMPISINHGLRGNHYIIDDNFKKKFKHWAINIKMMSMHKSGIRDEKQIEKLMEL